MITVIKNGLKIAHFSDEIINGNLTDSTATNLYSICCGDGDLPQYVDNISSDFYMFFNISPSTGVSLCIWDNRKA